MIYNLRKTSIGVCNRTKKLIRFSTYNRIVQYIFCLRTRRASAVSEKLERKSATNALFTGVFKIRNLCYVSRFNFELILFNKWPLRVKGFLRCTDNESADDPEMLSISRVAARTQCIHPESTRVVLSTLLRSFS